MPGVFVNPERCIGCRQCEIACAVEHSAGKDEATAFTEVPMPRPRVHVQPGPVGSMAYPNRCRHCDPAPCVQVCPTGAMWRDDEAGLVLMDAARCIGCALCAVVCPFDVISFHPLAEGPGPETAVAVKCDGCIDRLAVGREPACAEVCKVDALVFGDLNALLAAGRLRDAGAVLAAANAGPVPQPGGPMLDAWRAWHESAAALAAGDGHGDGNVLSPAGAAGQGGES